MQSKMASVEALVNGTSSLPADSSVATVKFATVSPAEIKAQDHVSSPPALPSLYSALSRPKMSVSLTPSSNLGFKRPLTQLVKRSLTITNNNAQPIAFKVKTTAPKLYCVRPNSGRVEPGGSQEVSVMLQALKEEPAMNAKCKDKFLIQSTIITPDKEPMSLQEIWAATDTNEDGKVHQQKLRVTYLPVEGPTVPEEPEELESNMPSIISDSHNFDTVAQHPPTNGPAPIPSAFRALAPHPEEETPHRPVTPPDTSFEESHEAQPAVVQQLSQEIPVIREPSHRAPSPPPAVPVPVPAPVPTPAPATVIETRPPVEHVSAPPPLPEVRKPVVVARVPEPAPAAPAPPVIITKENPLNQQLLSENKILKAELERMKNELAVKFTQPPPVSAVRSRRRHSDASDDAQTVVENVAIQHHQQDGVPLNVVVAISFAVFFMTYIFF